MIMAFFTAIGSFAENKIYIEDFSIAPGETKEIAVKLDFDQDVTKAMQFNIILPEGLSYKKTGKDETFTYTDDFDCSMFGSKVQSDNVTVKVSILSAKVEAGVHDILTFGVVASNAFAGGNIKINNQKVQSVAIAEQTTKVTAGSAGVDVKMVIDAASKWGTFVAPFDVTIPTGVKAYTATVNGEYAELTEVTTTIPANTAVVVYSENAVNETFTGVAGSTPVTTGALTGVFAATEATVGTYVLQNQGGVVAFYVVNSVKPTIGANRCYLTAPSSAKAIYFDEASAIAALQNASSIEGAYSASGVKNNGLKKGVNIVKMGDGSVQKIMVK